jgi:hypothetical protein
MRVLCVARHPFLSEHLERLFGRFDAETTACVGLDEATDLLMKHGADVMVCDYDLIVAVPRERWEDTIPSGTPVIAVSMTRRANEAHLPDDRSVAAFFYLPAFDDDDVRHTLHTLRRDRSATAPANGLTWAAPTPSAQFR